jgi:vacuolar-type H+-ATPase subunit C/Vma6
MSGPGRYAELAAAVRSFKAELIKPSQIDRLVEAGSLSETVSSLTSGHVSSVDPSDVTPVESYLVQRVVELAGRLASYAPQDSKMLIKHFASSFEFGCVIEILRAIADQLDPDEAVKHIVPTGKLTADRCKELIESHNANRVVEALNDESFRRFLGPRLCGERGLMKAVFAIDQYYYTRLWSASSLADPLDAQAARSLIGEFIDHLNILIAFRARLVGLDARSTSDLLIPVDYALGRAQSDLVESASVQNLIRVIDKTPYARAFQGASTLDASGSGLERVLHRSHAVSCVNSFAGSPFNVGLALAFLFLKNYELHDLFSIINGKANNVPLDRVVESLILRT